MSESANVAIADGGQIVDEAPPYLARFRHWFWQVGYGLSLVFVFSAVRRAFEGVEPFGWTVFGTAAQVLFAIGLTAAVAKGSTRIPAETSWSRRAIWLVPLILLAINLGFYLLYVRLGWP